jgi:hypothetical protein
MGRLGVFENRVLRGTFRPKRDETLGGWKKLQIDELQTFCTSPNIIKRVSLFGEAGHVARMKEERNTYRFLIGKTEVKSLLGKPRGRWEDNIRIGIWTGLAQDRSKWWVLLSTVMNLRVR